MDWDPFRRRLWTFVGNSLVYFDVEGKQWFDGPDHPCVDQGIVGGIEWRKYQDVKRQKQWKTPPTGDHWMSDDITKFDNVDTHTPMETADDRFQVPSKVVAGSIVAFESSIVVHCDNRNEELHVFDVATSRWMTTDKVMPKPPNTVSSELCLFGGTQLARLACNNDIPGLRVAVSMSHTWPLPSTVPALPIDRARSQFSLLSF
jgi:hypothetical protein